MGISKKLMLSSITAALALTIGGSTGAFAASEQNPAIESDPPMTIMVNWTGTAYLQSYGLWSNVTSSNNIFPDRPQVTNHTGNKGAIKVRIVDENMIQIGNAYTVSVGATVTMDRIPAFSGVYTLQATPYYDAGYYTISID